MLPASQGFCSMKVEQFPESKEYRKAARNLLSKVSRLMDEAVKTADPCRRRMIYLKAMSMSDEAYSLLGKAQNSPRKVGSPG